MTCQSNARWLLATLALLLLSACGGGGGGSNAPAAAAPAAVAQPPADQTGVVAILLKDAPTPDFTRVIMVISQVSLLPADDGGQQVILLDEPKELDLLELQNFYDMLAVSENVPVGDYEKIRLRVDDITVCYLDEAEAEVCEHAVVPANGKVDLNPRGSFTVAADTAILIEIDVDARKSFHVVENGNGRIRFRPVVFVDIQQRQALQGLLRVSGTVGEIYPDTSSFDLCDVDTELDTDTNGCLQVNTFEDTSIVSADGESVDFDSLTAGDLVTAYGIAVVVRDAHDDGSDSDDDDTVRMVQLDAIVVQKGAPEEIFSLSGTALTAVGADGIFSLDLDEGEELDEPQLDVLLQEATKILSAIDLAELDANAIDTGTVAEANGVIPDAASGVLHASLILIAPAEESREQLTGEVTSIDTETFNLFVDDGEPAGDRCVRPTAEAHFVIVTELADGGFDVQDASYEDLASDQEVTVLGADGADSCFDAEDVIIQLVEEGPPT